MEKQRKVKILSIVALVLAIAGMSLGFAAFSTTLNISSSASVSPSSSNFNVGFYSSPTTVLQDYEGDGSPDGDIYYETTSGAVAGTATIDTFQKPA